MNSPRYEPWSLLNRFQQDINRALNDGEPGISATSEWIPAVDIDECDDRFVLRADLPGVAPGSIDITLEKGVLAVSGERRLQREEGARRRAEAPAGRFHRQFLLPDTADAEGIQASSEHGVLTVTIAKVAPAQPRKIRVQ